MAHEILIVDDEPDIRMLIDGILRDEGYEVRGAGDSEEPERPGDQRNDQKYDGVVQHLPLPRTVWVPCLGDLKAAPFIRNMQAAPPADGAS